MSFGKEFRQRVRQFCLIDLTGVPKIESETADGLIRTIEAVQLLGAKVILAGISAVIADTFVAIGARFSRIKTTADLQSALEEAKKLLSAESSLTEPPFRSGTRLSVLDGGSLRRFLFRKSPCRPDTWANPSRTPFPPSGTQCGIL